MTDRAEIILGHTIAREFLQALRKNEEASKILPIKKSTKKRFKFTPLGFASILSAILCFGWFIFISIFNWFYDSDFKESEDIFLSLLFGFILIMFFFIILYLFREVFVDSASKDSRRIKIEIGDLMNKELENLKLEHTRAFPIIEQSLTIALADGTKENFIALLYATFLTELAIQDIDLIKKEKIKRLATAISHGNFIIESLDLTGIAKDAEIQKSLEIIIEGFNEVISFEESMENPDQLLLQNFLAIKKNFSLIAPVIANLKQIEKDSTFSKKIKQDADKLREITKTKPIAKTNISFSKESKGISSDELLSTITAIDEEIVEIRTRAGTYYTTISNIHKEDSREHREIELLTDKELEVKINVLKTTLDALEKEKQSLTDEDYLEIKSTNLALLFASESALERRKGAIVQIICPYCQEKNSSVLETCKKCENELPYCIVCSKSLSQGEQISVCPHCQSFAHSKHFKEWLVQSDTCPYCRRKIKGHLAKTILEQISKS